MVNFGDALGAEGQGADDGVSAYQLPSGSSAATIITSGGQPFSVGLPDDEDDGTLKPLPERLVMELGAMKGHPISQRRACALIGVDPRTVRREHPVNLLRDISGPFGWARVSLKLE